MPASCGKWPPTTSSAPSPAVATKTRSPVGSSKSATEAARAPVTAHAASDTERSSWARSVSSSSGMAQSRTTGAARATFSGALEHDHRDLPVGLLLVLVVGGPVPDHRLPQVGLLVGRRGPGPRREPVALDLHLDLGIRLEVEVPGGRGGGAALGGDDEVVVAALAVDERRAALLAGLTAGGGEDECLRALPVVADLAVGLHVAPDMFIAEEHRGSVKGVTVSWRAPRWHEATVFPQSIRGGWEVATPRPSWRRPRGCRSDRARPPPGSGPARRPARGPRRPCPG